VRQPTEEMGREMARLLLAALASGRQVPRQVVLATELVVRESSDVEGGEEGPREGNRAGHEDIDSRGVSAPPISGR